MNSHVKDRVNTLPLLKQLADAELQNFNYETMTVEEFEKKKWKLINTLRNYVVELNIQQPSRHQT